MGGGGGGRGGEGRIQLNSRVYYVVVLIREFSMALFVYAIATHCC